MLGRSLLLTLTLCVATVFAKTQNVNVQYAILTISNEHQLEIVETVLNATAPSQLSLFTPVKNKVHAEILSGNVDLAALATEIGTVLNSLDTSIPGFKTAKSEYIKSHQVDMYTINTYAPEASWDFLYAVFKSSATDLKATKALTELKKLNNEFEQGFASGQPNIKGMIEKISAFTSETQAATEYMFEGLYTVTGDHEITTYTSKLRAIQRGEALPLQTNESSSTDSESSSNEEDALVTGGDNISASSGANATAAAAAPALVTATPTRAPASTTITPSSGVGAVALSAAASLTTLIVGLFVL